MKLDLTEQIKEIQSNKGINGELIMRTVEEAIKKAYLKYYGTTENLVIRNEDDYLINIFSKKDIVENVEDDLFEITLEEARRINKDADIGDSMLVPCNPEEFGRIAIYLAKQIILQRLKEIEKNSIFSDFKSKQGELIIGYIQRIKNDIMFIDLGNFEGILRKTDQSPHETYQVGERIKVLVQEVKNNKQGNLSVSLTRRNPDFVRKLIEVEIPEIYDKTIQIFKIVREAGYRTKIAVFSSKDEVDPVGACVGQKGNRIQNVIKELEGEKIDILKYSSDPKEFIKNAMIPAKIENVIIIDTDKKKALVIVDDSQLSFAIGKRGLNIKLANELTDWEIEVKTEVQAIEAGIIIDKIKEAEELFKSSDEDSEDSIDYIADLDVSQAIKEALIENSINKIEDLIGLTEEDFTKLKGFSIEMAKELATYIEENFEVVEEDTEENNNESEDEESEEVIYQCPDCGASISEDTKKCPSCGVEFEE